MKYEKLFIFLVLSFVSLICLGFSGWNVYVPKNGEFIRVNLPDSINCMRDISTYLGNGPNFYQYNNYNDESIDFILFKALSEDILAINVDYPDSILPKNIVSRYLIDYDYKRAYSAYSRHHDLEEAVSNGLYTKQFICEVLHLPYNQYANRKSIIDQKNNYKYTFDGDILVSFKPTDGLDYPARDYKDTRPEIFNEISNYVRRYWKQNEEGYQKEINAHFHAIYNLRDGWRNEFLPLFYIEGDYVFNFIILDIILNFKEISLTDFLDYTHKTAKKIASKESPLGRIDTYRYKYFDFFFDQDGTFLKWKVVKEP